MVRPPRLLALLALVFVPRVLAQESDRDRRLEQEERVTGSCQICGGVTHGWRRILQTGNIRYETIGTIEAPAWCQRCTVDVQNGKIDPNDPPQLLPRDDEESPTEHNPWANPEQRDRTPKKVDKHKGEAHSAFGALPWVVGILGAVVMLVRWFLR